MDDNKAHSRAVAAVDAGRRAAAPDALRRQGRPGRAGRPRGDADRLHRQARAGRPQGRRAAALPHRARRRRSARARPTWPPASRPSLVPRRPAHRLRLLGLARTEGHARRRPSATRPSRTARKPATPPARRSTATGTTTCRWAAWPHLHVLDTSRRGQVRDLFEGTPYELPRASSPTPTRFDISPDGRRIVFAFDPAAGQAHRRPLRAGRDRPAERQRARARARRRPGTSARRATAPTAAHRLHRQPPGPQHTMPAQLALLRRASTRQRRWQSSARSGTTRSTRRCTGTTTARRCSSPPSRRAAATCGASTSRPARRVVVRGGWVQAFDGLRAGVIVSLADAATTRRGCTRTLPARPAAAHRDASTTRCWPPWRLRAARKSGSRAPTATRCRCGSPTRRASIGSGRQPRSKTWPLLHSIHGGPHAARRRHLALPLEHAALRGPGLRGGQRQLPRLERLRLRLPRQHHAPLGRARTAGHRGRHRLAADAALGRPRSASSPPAAATAATWWRG